MSRLIQVRMHWTWTTYIHKTKSQHHSYSLGSAYSKNNCASYVPHKRLVRCVTCQSVSHTPFQAFTYVHRRGRMLEKQKMITNMVRAHIDTCKWVTHRADTLLISSFCHIWELGPSWIELVCPSLICVPYQLFATRRPTQGVPRLTPIK